jgi:hypothetical protein
MKRKIEWKKDILDRWQFHFGLDSNNDKRHLWFNWRPSCFRLGFNVAINTLDAIEIEIDLWFNLTIIVLF